MTGEDDVKSMLMECDKCEATVDATVITNYGFYDPEDGPPGKYTFLKCPRCESPFVALQEDYGHGMDEPYRIFPPQQKKLDTSVPEGIRSAYQEAQSCLKGRAYTAAAIMCRKILEGICAEHGMSGTNLSRALKGLKEKGIIESRLFDWAEALRISGNEAVHDIHITLTSQDARDVMEFTEAILEYVFTFRDKFEAFQKRRSARPKKSN